MGASDEINQPEEFRRVLFELSMASDGQLEIRLDRTMKPLTTLAVVSALDMSRAELRRAISWGGSDE